MAKRNSHNGDRDGPACSNMRPATGLFEEVRTLVRWNWDWRSSWSYFFWTDCSRLRLDTENKMKTFVPRNANRTNTKAPYLTPDQQLQRRLFHHPSFYFVSYNFEWCMPIWLMVKVSCWMARKKWKFSSGIIHPVSAIHCSVGHFTYNFDVRALVFIISFHFILYFL